MAPYSFKELLTLVYRHHENKYFLLSSSLCCTDMIYALDDDLLKIASIVSTINSCCVLWNRRLINQCPFCLAPIIATFQTGEGRSLVIDFTKERVSV